MHGLGHAKVDHLGHRPTVVLGDQHIRRLDIAVDDALLMSVLDGMADRQEQFQSFAGIQAIFVAVAGDRLALDQFHDEVRPAAEKGDRNLLPERPFECFAQKVPVPFFSTDCSRVQHPGDVGMIHH